jgi:hypothetical protein
LALSLTWRIDQHTLVRALPHSLPQLHALQVTFILDAGTPPVSMTGVAPSSTHHHYGGGMIEPHSSASATMLHELRQCVVDALQMGLEVRKQGKNAKEGKDADVDGVERVRDVRQDDEEEGLEWMGFSWQSGSGGGGRRGGDVDAEGNPWVFLSRVMRESEEISDSEGEEDGKDVKGKDKGKGRVREFVWDADRDEKGSGRSDVGKMRREGGAAKKKEMTLWAENDLNISEVQGVKMWDKEIWAGRL